MIEVGFVAREGVEAVAGDDGIRLLANFLYVGDGRGLPRFVPPFTSLKVVLRSR